MPQLSNKIAIVTGAGSGFGEGIARAFVAEGAKVVLTDINSAAVERVAGELGENALSYTCDVADKAQIQALVDHCVATWGVPDIVVNNAGIAQDNQPVTETDEETYDRLFAVNVKSVYNMTVAVVPLMKARRSGVILNIGSTAGIRPRPGLTWYNATKAAVNNISKTMAVELGPDNIRVNAICPVIGETGLTSQFMGVPDTPENRAKFVATIPLGRFSTPRDIATAAVFLASDAADFLTGMEFTVDGGRTV
ncbi:MAG: SDR family oxidoreductase [Caldilineaceae bacterium]